MTSHHPVTARRYHCGKNGDGIVGRNLIAARTALFFTLLFGLDVVSTASTMRDEFQARKVKKKHGLKKAWHTVDEDTARRWFEAHLGTAATHSPENPAADDLRPCDVIRRNLADTTRKIGS